MSPPRAYFGYSPLIEKHPGGEVAEALDVDLVFDVPSTRWNGRIGALAKRPSHSVFGKLYSAEQGKDLVKDLLKADQAELAPAAGSRLQEIEVQVRAGGKTVTATALGGSSGGWTQAAASAGAVSETYARALARAAEAARLPPDYVTRLKAEAELLQRVQTFGKQHGLSND